MIKKFTYPLPDELYVNSFSKGFKTSLTYNGPENVSILVNKYSGIVSGINPEAYDSNEYNLVNISAKENPEICYFALSSSESHEYQYEEEIMPNGDVYQKIINPTLHDAYTLSYNLETNKVELELIVKSVEDNALIQVLFAIKNRLNFIILNEEGKIEKNESSEVSGKVLEEISSIIKNIDSVIEDKPKIMDWKYTDKTSAVSALIPISDEVKSLLENYQ